MFITSINHLHNYTHLHSGFEKAGQFLARSDLAALVDGWHEIDGDELFAIVSACEGKGRAARLEAHRCYIDVQFCLLGKDVIGFRPLAQGSIAEVAYDEALDVIFLRSLSASESV